MQNKPLVSIITPAYNSEKFIIEAIESVGNQTYQNWELIIVDDCSTDRTTQIVRQYASEDGRIKLHILKNNSGTAVARNHAINMANGKYIAFLDSDDIWHSHKLEKQVSLMENEKCLFTCTNYAKIDEEGKSIGHTIKARSESNYHDILKRCPGNSTVMYNAEEIGKVSIPDIRKRNDYVMWLSVIKKAQILYGIDESLSCHRVREGSLSSSKLSLVKYHWKVYRDIESLSVVESVYLIMYWSLMTLIRIHR